MHLLLTLLWDLKKPIFLPLAEVYMLDNNSNNYLFIDEIYSIYHLIFFPNHGIIHNVEEHQKKCDPCNQKEMIV